VTLTTTARLAAGVKKANTGFLFLFSSFQVDIFLVNEGNGSLSSFTL
jgi:hypothetical protein